MRNNVQDKLGNPPTPSVLGVRYQWRVEHSTTYTNNYLKMIIYWKHKRDPASKLWHNFHKYKQIAMY